MVSASFSSSLHISCARLEAKPREAKSREAKSREAKSRCKMGRSYDEMLDDIKRTTTKNAPDDT
jgi:hypothetical protein